MAGAGVKPRRGAYVTPSCFLAVAKPRRSSQSYPAGLPVSAGCHTTAGAHAFQAAPCYRRAEHGMGQLYALPTAVVQTASVSGSCGLSPKRRRGVEPRTTAEGALAVVVRPAPRAACGGLSVASPRIPVSPGGRALSIMPLALTFAHYGFQLRGPSSPKAAGRNRTCSGFMGHRLFPCRGLFTRYAAAAHAACHRPRRRCSKSPSRSAIHPADLESPVNNPVVGGEALGYGPVDAREFYAAAGCQDTTC